MDNFDLRAAAKGRIPLSSVCVGENVNGTMMFVKLLLLLYAYVR